MDWKGRLLEQAMKVMQDERVMRVAQDERVMKTVMQAIELRGKIQEGMDDQIEKVAKTLNLATQREVSDLRRTIRRLERELERQKPGDPAK
jgi:polyhydroxyalkanoate synthesis regulator phasin